MRDIPLKRQLYNMQHSAFGLPLVLSHPGASHWHASDLDVHGFSTTTGVVGNLESLQEV